MPERSQLSEETRKKFDGVKRTINQALFGGTRFLPRGTTNLRSILMDSIELLDDEEYLARYTNRFALPSERPEAVRANTRLLNGFQAVQATYVPPLIQTEAKSIYVKSSFVSDPANKPETIVQYLLEELAHSFYQHEPLFPIEKLPLQSARFLPEQNKVDFLARLQRERSAIYGVDGEIDQSHIFVQKAGFMTLYWSDDVSGRQYVPYLSTRYQIALEEARASVLQIIFLVKVIGSKVKPFGTNEDQVLNGILFFSRDMQREESPYRRYGTHQIEALDLVRIYCASGRYIDRISDLIFQLHSTDPDAFFERLLTESPVCVSIFNRLMDSIAQERWVR